MNTVEAASDLLNPPTDWLSRLQRDLDREIGDRVIPAEKIAAVLETRGNISVRPKDKPRINLRVLFDFDSDRLEAQGRQQVEELGKSLTPLVNERHYRVKVIDHTNAQGDEAYNQDLSERRAQQVVAALDRDFPALAGALTAEGRGKRELHYSEWTEEAHRLNRRVEVELVR